MAGAAARAGPRRGRAAAAAAAHAPGGDGRAARADGAWRWQQQAHAAGARPPQADRSRRASAPPGAVGGAGSCALRWATGWRCCAPVRRAPWPRCRRAAASLRCRSARSRRGPRLRMWRLVSRQADEPPGQRHGRGAGAAVRGTRAKPGVRSARLAGGRGDPGARALHQRRLHGQHAVRADHPRQRARARLRQVVREELATNPLVSAFRPAEAREGGEGVTVGPAWRARGLLQQDLEIRFLALAADPL